MLRRYLLVICLANLVIAEIPSYIMVCGRRNPNLDECAKRSTEAIRDKLRTGIPELDIPSVEPLRIARFSLLDTDALKVRASDVKLHGLSNFEIKKVHIDLEKKKFSLALVFKNVILDAKYDANVRIIFPISGRGPFHLEMDDVLSEMTFTYKVTKKNGDDAERMFFTSLSTKITIDKFKAVFETPEGDDATLNTALNAALEGPSRQEMLESIKPAIEKVISIEILRMGNKINSHFTYDEMFPDRE